VHTEVKKICCPYCGETVDIVVDTSINNQQYIEDCSVCCRPIEIEVFITNNDITVISKRDDE
jgi:hypothetical protein